MTAASIALALHALAAVVWVGGMAFAWGVLRPVAADVLAGSERQRLWRQVFARFLPMVWVAAILLLVTGYYLVFVVYGGFGAAGIHVHIMHGLGLLMVALFLHLFFAPWKRFRRAVDAGDPEQGAVNLASIRRTVLINLVLGLIVVAIGAGGRLWPG